MHSGELVALLWNQQRLSSHWHEHARPSGSLFRASRPNSCSHWRPLIRESWWFVLFSLMKTKHSHISMGWKASPIELSRLAWLLCMHMTHSACSAFSPLQMWRVAGFTCIRGVLLSGSASTVRSTHAPYTLLQNTFHPHRLLVKWWQHPHPHRISNKANDVWSTTSYKNKTKQWRLDLNTELR